MKKFLLSGLYLLALVTITSCSKETRINLLVTIEKQAEEVPVSNVKFDILPYNIETVRDSLKGVNNPGPMPSREAMLEVRNQYENILVEYEKTLDVLEETEKELKLIKDTRSPAYRKAFNKHERAKKVNDDMYKEKQDILEEYLSRKEAYEQELKQWESRAYKGLEDYVSSIRELRKITDDYSIKTDKEGKGSAVVPGGDWWVRGKVRNPNQKYTVYYWNEHVEAKGGLLTVELTSRIAQVVEE